MLERDELVTLIVRKLIRLAIRRWWESFSCTECFGTGLRGGFAVTCSHGHEAVR